MRTSLADIFHLLVRAETLLWNVLEGEIRRKHGLSLGRAEVLRVIHEAQPVSERSISQIMSVPAATIHGLVGWLELAGLCVRSALPDDDSLSSTPGGSKLLSEVDETIKEHLERVLGNDFDQANLDGVARLLRLMSDTLAALPPDSSRDSHWAT